MVSIFSMNKKADQFSKFLCWQQQIFRLLDASTASASERSHCILSESGMVYRILGYYFTNSADWNFQKWVTQQKLKKFLQFWSCCLLTFFHFSGSCFLLQQGFFFFFMASFFLSPWPFSFPLRTFFFYHGNFSFAASFFLLLWPVVFLPRVFSFCCKIFPLALIFSFLPQAFSFAASIFALSLNEKR